MPTASELIAALGLQPLAPEGGYYRETYRATDSLAAGALPPRYGRDKALSTAIYYLLTPDTFSSIHRLPSDEVYHFYLGDPVELLRLWPDGRGDLTILGPDVLGGQLVQGVVPAGVWQGSRLLHSAGFALMGTTMAPGFDMQDFEPGRGDELASQYPAFADSIRALTRLS